MLGVCRCRRFLDQCHRTPRCLQEEEPKDDDDSGYVEVGTKTTVSVTATAYDERSGKDSGCGDDGCLPALAHDGVGEEDIESRWSCSKNIVSGNGQCEIEFTFGNPQDIKDVEVAFWKGDERTRTLKVIPSWPEAALVNTLAAFESTIKREH